MKKSPVAEKFKVTKGGIEYEFEFEAADEGGYAVSVPLFPSCASQGNTFKEALSNIQDALIDCLGAASDLKLPIPQQLEPLLRQTAKP